MRKLSLVSLLSLVLMLSACGAPIAGGDTPGNELLQDGITGLYYDVDTASYEVGFIGTMMAPEGQVPQEINFDIDLSGDLDNTNPSEPKFSMNVDLGGAMDGGDEEHLLGSILSDAQNFYMQLESISDFDGTVGPEMVEGFVGKWWRMEIPPGAFAEIDKKSDMTPEQEQIKELAKSTNFFKNISYVGNETVMGAKTYKFSAELDKDAVKNFLIEVAKIDSNVPEPTASDLAELDEMLATFEMNGDFFVGVDDKVMHGAMGSISMTPPEGGSMILDFDFKVGNLNDTVTVDVPTESELFDPLMLLGMGGGF